MIIYDKKKLKQISWSDDSFYILIDFDRTLTSANSEVSWGILSKSKFAPKEYVLDRTKIHNHYRPIEVDENIDKKTKQKLMEEWWNTHIGLLVKYKFPQKLTLEASNLDSMKFRRGSKEFLKAMHKRNIPVIILSAGIGNFITEFLKKHHCFYDNIHLVSNFLTFKNGCVSGMQGIPIHTFNKNEVSFSQEIKAIIKERPNTILFGDTTADAKMSNKKKNILRVGFLDEKIEENLEAYKRVFDIVATDNTSFSELREIIGVLKDGS